MTQEVEKFFLQEAKSRKDHEGEIMKMIDGKSDELKMMI